MRAAAIGLAILAVAAACSAIPPLGARRIDAVVSNTAGIPLELGVRTEAGEEIQGAVSPSALPAGARGVPVAFFVPQGEDWWILANGVEQFSATDTTDHNRAACRLMMEIGRDGSGSIGCDR